MAELVRRIVSGYKARHYDKELGIELDLAYIDTSKKVVVMGYPAVGLEAVYRNRRKDVLRFLEARHKGSYHVFNLCPTSENSYSQDVFDTGVSRYPFPDHYAPPLAMLPLAVREMHAWIDGTNEPTEDKSQIRDRVLVIHCKAGKGRSGTMACAYLLTAPTLFNGGSISAEHAASDSTLCERPSRELLSAPAAASDSEKNTSSSALSHPKSGSLRRRGGPPRAGPSSSTVPLETVLRLHAEKRMKAATSKSGNRRMGVSIPSQRRFLNYWVRVLSKDTPGDFWAAEPHHRQPLPVRLCNITVKMSDLSPLKSALFKIVNRYHHVAGRAKASAAEEKSPVWASLSRYDDELVKGLEQREWDTRPNDETERRETGQSNINKFLDDGQWDSRKMVNSFARLRAAEDDAPQREEKGVTTHTLRLGTTGENYRMSVAKNEHASAECAVTDEGVILDANREVRVKLFMGQVFLGWFWFIPRFHMPVASPTSAGAGVPSSFSLTLTRKDLDFAWGFGQHILAVEVVMEHSPDQVGSS